MTYYKNQPSFKNSAEKRCSFSRKKVLFSLHVRDNRKPIEIKEQAKVVGTRLESLLSWKLHIENKVVQCKQIFFSK